MKIIRNLVLAALIAALPATAAAQTWPDKAVKVIVPFAAAGPTDVIARILSQKLSESLGQQFYVENVAGGGGNIGTGAAAKAAPDGYTLLMSTATVAITNPAIPRFTKP